MSHEYPPKNLGAHFKHVYPHAYMNHLMMDQPEIFEFVSPQGRLISLEDADRTSDEYFVKKLRYSVLHRHHITSFSGSTTSLRIYQSPQGEKMTVTMMPRGSNGSVLVGIVNSISSGESKIKRVQ